MNDARKIVNYLIETEDFPDEDDLDVKELVEPGRDMVAGPTSVQRHGRFKIVDMPLYTFLISYLTPVAYYDKIFKIYYRSLKQWSPTTNNHIHQWQRLIWQSPEWKNNPANHEPSEVTPGNHYVRYPRFKTVRQERISTLFRELIKTMEIKPHMKRRMYHVDPRMRQGSEMTKGWLSGHLKHHDTGEEGLPKPQDAGYSEFFTDFDPPEPEDWEWGSGLRDRTPHETGRPDEE